MHKTFKKVPTNLSIIEKLSLLRKKLKEYKLDAFLVPHNDMFFNEITAPYYSRLEWITGFTGSAGFAIILKSSAVIFTDGRYSIQVEKEVNKRCFEFESITKIKPFSWLKKNRKRCKTVGFDPWLHSIEEIEYQRPALTKLVTLKKVDNLIDKIWFDKPVENCKKPFLRPVKLSGKNTSFKINQVQEKLKMDKDSGFILTCPDSICWLANIRGQDIPNSPLMNCYAVVYLNEICIYSTKKIYRNNSIQLKKNVTLKHFEHFFTDIKSLKKILLDRTTTPYVLTTKIIGFRRKIEYVNNPITLLKALKNPTELKGAFKSHMKDGVALSRFLKWFENSRIEKLDEISLVDKLESYRKIDFSFYYNSFDTISATGSNGAIVHYRVSNESNKKIDISNLTLVDSGGQYLEGTTDVTRTIIKGRSSAEQRFYYTKVLKGLIFLSKLKWPVGLTGKELDPLARYFLWEHNLDYDHGTGHGVGAFSSVHQGPQGITKLNTVPLEPGMILSIEPGIYIKGKLGIRLENLVYVKESKNKLRRNKVFLEFKTLTLVPFEKKLVERNLLSNEELSWINLYHHRIYKTLSPYLVNTEKEWLRKACKRM